MSPGVRILRRRRPTTSSIPRRSLLGGFASTLTAWLASAPGRLFAAQDADARRVFAVRAHEFRFEPATIEVRQNDLVVVQLDATDIPHSFVIDSYRILKRASPGHPVRFEFRADRAGTFPFYCNLTADDRCKNMRGQLVVRER